MKKKSKRKFKKNFEENNTLGKSMISSDKLIKDRNWTELAISHFLGGSDEVFYDYKSRKYVDLYYLEKVIEIENSPNFDEFLTKYASSSNSVPRIKKAIDSIDYLSDFIDFETVKNLAKDRYIYFWNKGPNTMGKPDKYDYELHYQEVCLMYLFSRCYEHVKVSELLIYIQHFDLQDYLDISIYTYLSNKYPNLYELISLKIRKLQFV